MSDPGEAITDEVRRHYPNRQPAFETLVARRRRRRTVRATFAGVFVVGACVLAGITITSALQLLPRDGDPAELAAYGDGKVLIQLHGRDCGRIKTDLTDPDPKDPDWRDPNPKPATEQIRCLLDAFRTGTAAYMTTQYPTMEGDPIRTLYQVVDKGLVDVVDDSTEDAWGSRDIFQYQCRTLERSEDVFAGVESDRCEPFPQRPLIALTEDGFSHCGRLELDLGKPDAEPADEKVTCLLDGFRTGRSVVLTVEFHTEEGDSIRAHYKVVGEGQVDILYDSTHDRFGSRHITKLHCRALVPGEPVLEHGDCRGANAS